MRSVTQLTQTRKDDLAGRADAHDQRFEALATQLETERQAQHRHVEDVDTTLTRIQANVQQQGRELVAQLETLERDQARDVAELTAPGWTLSVLDWSRSPPMPGAQCIPCPSAWRCPGAGDTSIERGPTARTGGARGTTRADRRSTKNGRDAHKAQESVIYKKVVKETKRGV